MLCYALIFVIVAVLAGILGFAGIAGMARHIAQAIFIAFLALAVVSWLVGRRRSAM